MNQTKRLFSRQWLCYTMVCPVTGASLLFIPERVQITHGDRREPSANHRSGISVATSGSTAVPGRHLAPDAGLRGVRRGIRPRHRRHAQRRQKTTGSRPPLTLVPRQLADVKDNAVDGGTGERRQTDEQHCGPQHSGHNQTATVKRSISNTMQLDANLPGRTNSFIQIQRVPEVHWAADHL